MHIESCLDAPQAGSHFCREAVCVKGGSAQGRDVQGCLCTVSFRTDSFTAREAQILQEVAQALACTCRLFSTG